MDDPGRQLLTPTNAPTLGAETTARVPVTGEQTLTPSVPDLPFQSLADQIDPPVAAQWPATAEMAASPILDTGDEQSALYAASTWEGMDAGPPPSTASDEPPPGMARVLGSAFGEPERVRPQLSDYDRAVLEVRKDRLRSSLYDAVVYEPEPYAEAERIARQFRLPTELVYSELSKFRLRAKREQLDLTAVDLLEEAPGLARALEDTTFAAVAQDEIGFLASIEKRFRDSMEAIARQYQYGTEELRLMELMARETLPGVYGELSDEDKVDLVVLRETQKLRQYEPDQWPVFSASAAARQLPYTLQAVEGAVTGGLAGAAAGAVGGAAIGSTASGVGAIPGAITGAAALGSRGAIAGSYAQLLPYMIGEAALGLEEIRDVDGQKLDPDLRRGLAVTVGIINSGAEVVGFGALASPVLTLFSDTVRRIGARLGAKQMAEAVLRSPTAVAALERFGKEIAKGTGIEVLTEVFQEFSVDMFSELGKALSVDRAFDATDWTERISNYADVAAQTIAAASVYSGAASTIALGADLAAVRRSRQAQEAVAALGDLGAGSALRERLPEALRTAADNIAKAGGTVTDIRIDAEQFTTYFQRAGIDPRKAAAEVGVEPDILDLAVQQKADIVVPLGRYVERLAGTEHHAALAPYLKLRPGDYSQAEIERIQTELLRRAEDVRAEVERASEVPASARAIFDEVRSQLVQTGQFDETAASRVASLIASSFATQAERAGIDPNELFAEYGLDIRGVLPGLREMIVGKQAESGIAASLERLRSWSQRMERASKEAEARGETFAPDFGDQLTKEDLELLDVVDELELDVGTLTAEQLMALAAGDRRVRVATEAAKKAKPAAGAKTGKEVTYEQQPEEQQQQPEEQQQQPEERAERADIGERLFRIFDALRYPSDTGRGAAVGGQDSIAIGRLAGGARRAARAYRRTQKEGAGGPVTRLRAATGIRRGFRELVDWPTVEELGSGAEAQTRYASAVSATAEKNPLGTSLDRIEDWPSARWYLSETGDSGFGLTPDGHIVGLFTNGERRLESVALLRLAVELGGRTVATVDNLRRDLYAVAGFVEAAWTYLDPTVLPEAVQRMSGTPNDPVATAERGRHVFMAWRPQIEDTERLGRYVVDFDAGLAEARRVAALPEGDQSDNVYYQTDEHEEIGRHYVVTTASERAERIARRAKLEPGDAEVIASEAERLGIPAEKLRQRLLAWRAFYTRSDGWLVPKLKGFKVDEKATGDEQAVNPEFYEIGWAFHRGNKAKMVQRIVHELYEVVRRADADDTTARSILSQASWYRAMRDRLRKQFGGMTDFFIDVLAATSPMTVVRQNWEQALEILDLASSGAYDDLIPLWEKWWEKAEAARDEFDRWAQAYRAEHGLSLDALKKDPEFLVRREMMRAATVLPQSIAPRRANEKRFGVNSLHVIKALIATFRQVHGKDFSRSLRAPKIWNFAGNLAGYTDAATIDIWAARTLQRVAGFDRIPPAAEAAVEGGVEPGGKVVGPFAFGQDVIAAVAERLTAENRDARLVGLSPMDLQAILWFLEKERWYRSGYSPASGGSFELELSYTGIRDQRRVKQLRDIAETSRTDPQARADALRRLRSMLRDVDRYVGGISQQREGFVPSDAQQAEMAERIKRAIYAASREKDLIASKTASTEGIYGDEPERSVDVEVVTREGYDPKPLMVQLLEEAKNAQQDAMFLARVLRSDEYVDPAFHRPGIEVYFLRPMARDELEPVLDELRRAGLDSGFTLITDGRPTPSRPGRMPHIVGVRAINMPEFAVRYGFGGDYEAAINDPDRLSQLVLESAEGQAKVIAELREMPDVAVAVQLWYEVDTRFSHEYDKRAEALQSAGAGGDVGGPAPRVWRGRPFNEAVRAAKRQRDWAALGGGVPPADPVYYQEAPEELTGDLPDTRWTAERLVRWPGLFSRHMKVLLEQSARRGLGWPDIAHIEMEVTTAGQYEYAINEVRMSSTYEKLFAGDLRKDVWPLLAKPDQLMPYGALGGIVTLRHELGHWLDMHIPPTEQGDNPTLCIDRNHREKSSAPLSIQPKYLPRILEAVAADVATWGPLFETADPMDLSVRDLRGWRVGPAAQLRGAQRRVPIIPGTRGWLDFRREGMTNAEALDAMRLEFIARGLPMPLSLRNVDMEIIDAFARKKPRDPTGYQPSPAELEELRINKLAQMINAARLAAHMLENRQFDGWTADHIMTMLGPLSPSWLRYILAITEEMTAGERGSKVGGGAHGDTYFLYSDELPDTGGFRQLHIMEIAANYVALDAHAVHDSTVRDFVQRIMPNTMRAFDYVYDDAYGAGGQYAAAAHGARAGGVLQPVPAATAAPTSGRPARLADDRVAGAREPAEGAAGRAGLGVAESPDAGLIAQAKAWHGTPHAFERFSIDHIGSGEGRQAFGWGLYFASERGVAEYYRRALTRETDNRGRLFEVQLRPSEDDYLSWDVPLYRMPDKIKDAVTKTLQQVVTNYRDLGDRPWLSDWFHARYLADSYPNLGFDPELEVIEIHHAYIMPLDIRLNILPDPKNPSKWLVVAGRGLSTVSLPDDAFPERFDTAEAAKNWAKNVDVLAGYEKLTGGSIHDMLVQMASTFAANPMAYVARSLRENGVRGIKYLDAFSRDDGEGSYNYVIFHDDDVLIEKIYEQRRTGAAEPLGSVTFRPKNTIIQLYAKADRSTILHESAHVFFQVLLDLVRSGRASDQQRVDLLTLMKWFGVNDPAEVGVEEHEKFAKGFESYLRTGQAPAVWLKPAFDAFRRWLIRVYESLRATRKLEDVGLTPEVRAVMDRMVASDVAIEETERLARLDPLFSKPSQAGMTPAEFDEYVRRAQELTQQAKDRALRLAIGQLERERRLATGELRDRIRDEVTAEVRSRREYVAIRYLSTGENDLGLTPGAKLGSEHLIENWGKDILQSLRKAVPPIFAPGGAHPDTLAPLLGFSSGNELVEVLAGTPPSSEVIEAEVERRVAEELAANPDFRSVDDIAVDVTASDERIQFLADELAVLTRRPRRAGEGPTPYEIIKQAAERYVESLTVGQIERGDDFLRRSANAATEASAAVLRGDLATAAEAKRRQIFNLLAFQKARRVRREIERGIARATRLAKRKPKSGIPADYGVQIDAILDRFEFRKISKKEKQRRANLRAFVAAREADGDTVAIPERLLDEAYRADYRDLKYSEFVDVIDTLKHLEKLARLKGRLLASKKKRDLEEVVDDIVSAIAESNDIKPKKQTFHQTRRDKLARMFRAGVFSMTRIEFLFNQLAGEHGPLWEYVFRPLADAESEEQVLNDELVTKLHAILDRYTRKERADWYKKPFFVKELGAEFNKASLLALALNWGNEGNRKAIMDGYRWTEEAVQRALDNHLDARDWQTVQAIWDLINSLWPRIEALELELTGVAPEKVDALKVLTRWGVFDGGYYPLVYEGFRAEVREDAKTVDEMFGGNWITPATRRGHTKERVGSGGQKVRLDLSVLGGHIDQVVHDLTHRKAVIDAVKIISHPRVQAAITAVAGEEVYRGLRPWLANVAAPRREPAHMMERILSRARTGVTVVNMGWKISTALVQPIGYTQTVAVLGFKWAMKGIQSVYSNPAKISQRVHEIMRLSPAVRFRAQTFDRDVNDAIRKLSSRGPISRVAESFFWLTAMTDLGTVLPTWQGAFMKAQAEGKDEAEAIAYADSIVRLSQGSASRKDLPAVMRGSETFRIFTMFYSYFNVLFNLLAKELRLAKNVRNWPKVIANLIWLWFLPAVLTELALGRGPDEDDDETWLGWAAEKILAYPLLSVVLLRDVVSAVVDDFGYDLSPAGEAFAGLAKTVRDLTEGDELSRAELKNLWLTISAYLAWPGRQLWITGETLFDWLVDGRYRPENVLQALRDLALARPPERKVE